MTIQVNRRRKVPRKSEGPRDRIDLRVKPEWHARVMRQAERLGMDVSDYIRQATTLKLEQDEATEPDLQQEGGDE